MESRDKENTYAGFEIFLRPLRYRPPKLTTHGKIAKTTHLQFSCCGSPKNHPNGMPLGTIVEDMLTNKFRPDMTPLRGQNGHFPTKKWVEKI